MKFKAGDRVLVLSNKKTGTIDSIEEDHTIMHGSLGGSHNKPLEWKYKITWYNIDLDKTKKDKEILEIDFAGFEAFLEKLRTTEDDIVLLDDVSQLLYGEID